MKLDLSGEMSGCLSGFWSDPTTVRSMPTSVYGPFVGNVEFSKYKRGREDLGRSGAEGGLE